MAPKQRGRDRGGTSRVRGGGSSVKQCEAQVAEAASNGRVRVTGPNRQLPEKTITIKWEPGMPKVEFRRKAEALKRLGEEGKLYKATNPVARDRKVTKSYRQHIIDRIWELYHERNPEFANKLIKRVTEKMDPDHVWELQLGGPDNWDNLRFLDRKTNQTIGKYQIWPQIRNLPDGTPIRIEVIGPPD
ncbi:MAG TPA: endonuclease [Micromonospora sp.]